MISIISAVHNQLGMNRLFVERLEKYTSNEYELIIIDNNSTDGSREYFLEHADIVIENKGNYSYPYCQNQGIKAAKYDKLVFLNNDIIVSPNWDDQIVEVQEEHALDAISFASIDRMESVAVTRKLRNKWKRIKYPLLLLGTGQRNLAIMHKLMYGNWENFTQKRYRKFTNEIYEGVSGSCILTNRSLFDKIGLWDERIQGGDFDLFCRIKKRSVEVGDIKPMHIALGVYFHHFTRLTLKGGYDPFIDRDNHITFDEKWGSEAQELVKGIDFD